MATRTSIANSKWADIERRLLEAGVLPGDLEESFARASGPGGQHVNKTATAVRLRHRPSGTDIRAQSARSQRQNRYDARVRLLEALLATEAETLARAKAKLDKIRRQKNKRSRRAKAKVLADKHHQSEKKAKRRPPEE